MMNTDTPMQLIVETNLFVWFVVVSRKLNAVHPQVCFHQTSFNSHAQHLRKCDERTAVIGPAMQLG